MNQSHYSIAIIKPDAHRDILVEMITEDIKQGGLDIVYAKDMSLSVEQAQKIYSDHINDPHFETCVKSLYGEKQHNCATILIIKSKNGHSLDKLQRIKGRADKDGIRLKYKLFSREEFEEKGYTGEGLKEELAKNRIHVPDSDELNIDLIKILLSDKEIKMLKEREP